MPENKQETSSPYRHRSIFKQPLFWIVAIVIVAAVAFIVPHYLARGESSSSNKDTAKIETTNQTQKTTDSSQPKEEVKTDTGSPETDGKTPAQYDGENPNNNESLTGSLTTARFNGDTLILRVNIDQYLTGGTCTLEISDGANALKKTANITPIASTSSCEGFDIQEAEVSGFSRPLNIRIDLSSDGKIGTIEGKVE